MMEIQDLPKDFSFGVVPMKMINNDWRFLIISHNSGHWGFPKGHREEGESETETALRELYEEGGVTRCDLIDGTFFEDCYIRIHNGVKYLKTVHYYLGMVRQETDDYCDPDEDIVSRCWVSYDDGMSQLTHQSAKEILRKAHDYCKKYLLK